MAADISNGIYLDSWPITECYYDSYLNECSWKKVWMQSIGISRYYEEKFQFENHSLYILLKYWY